MKEIQCNIKDSEGNYQGCIKARLAFDVPDEMLTMLGKMLGSAWDKWQDRIIKWDKGNGSRRT